MRKGVYYTFKDINSNSVNVDYSEILKVLREEDGNLLFGMNWKSIHALKKQYLLRRGGMPVTVQKINEVFSKEKGV